MLAHKRERRLFTYPHTRFKRLAIIEHHKTGVCSSAKVKKTKKTQQTIFATQKGLFLFIQKKLYEREDNRDTRDVD